MPLLAGRFLPDLPRLRAPGTLLRLLLVVLGDIVVANLEVARRILGRESALRPAFVRVPLDLREPLGIAAARRHRDADARHGVGRPDRCGR